MFFHELSYVSCFFSLFVGKKAHAAEYLWSFICDFQVFLVFFRVSHIFMIFEYFFGKRRLRQSIDDLFCMNFHGFLEILIFSWFFEHIFGKKAPAAEYRWPLLYWFSRLFWISLILNNFWNICWGKRRLRQNIYELFICVGDVLVMF